MKKLLLTMCSVVFLFSAESQTTLFQDDFESGSGNWSFNGSGDNAWTINNAYLGYSPFIVDTPNQPAGISNGPQSYYMHIVNGTVCSGLSVCNANFDTGSTSLQNADLATGLNATGATDVTLSFWYLCAGAAGTSYGTVHYSIDGGSTWTNVGTYSGTSNWTQETIVLTGAAGAANVKVRFQWQNGGAGNDPAFSVDDVLITAVTGGGSNSITTTNDVSPASWCYGSNENVTVNFVATGTFTAGNVYTAEISDASGSFAAPTAIGSLASSASGSLTINGVVPGTMAVGTGYRIRVVATSPSTTGTDNGSDLVINALPTVTFSALSQVCVYNDPFTLTQGSPSGGTYSGNGVTANTFDPAAAGVNTHTITYTYTDGNGCSNSAQQSIIVDACASIDEVEIQTLKLFPNPANEAFSLSGNEAYSSLEIMDMSGRIVKSYSHSQKSYSLEGMPTGVYMVKVKLENNTKTFRLIRK